ncbi:MAG: 50S ribosomal protein L32 [Deltaproteobacteria bacterium]|nr:50S ribosomal protein L32 [Deltaproteobacteria bacterium]
MAVPTRRTSRSVSKKRRTHKNLPQVNFVTCSNCQEMILPHRVCPKCGYYHGKQIVAVEE